MDNHDFKNEFAASLVAGELEVLYAADDGALRTSVCTLDPAVTGVTALDSLLRMGSKIRVFDVARLGWIAIDLGGVKKWKTVYE